MQITSDQVIAGFPAMHLRDAFARMHGGPWDTAYLATLLGIEQEEAEVAADRLLNEGLIEHDSMVGQSQLYCCTGRGGQLAHASAGKPITRATADRLVRTVVERAAEVNSDGTYVFWVDSLTVFGSYLGDSERLGDVDILVTLSPRHDDPKEHEQAARNFSDEAEAAGRRFPTLVDSLFWPSQAVFRHLRGRSTALSLHSHHDSIAVEAEGRVLYQREG